MINKDFPEVKKYQERMLEDLRHLSYMVDIITNMMPHNEFQETHDLDDLVENFGGASGTLFHYMASLVSDMELCHGEEWVEPFEKAAEDKK